MLQLSKQNKGSEYWCSCYPSSLYGPVSMWLVNLWPGSSPLSVLSNPVVLSDWFDWWLLKCYVPSEFLYDLHYTQFITLANLVVRPRELHNYMNIYQTLWLQIIGCCGQYNELYCHQCSQLQQNIILLYEVNLIQDERGHDIEKWMYS